MMGSCLRLIFAAATARMVSKIDRPCSVTRIKMPRPGRNGSIYLCMSGFRKVCAEWLGWGVVGLEKGVFRLFVFFGGKGSKAVKLFFFKKKSLRIVRFDVFS